MIFDEIPNLITDRSAELMATKRKSTGRGSPPVSSPAVRPPVLSSPAIRSTATSSLAKGTPTVTAVSEENVEQDGDDLNMSDDEEGGTRIGDIYIPPPVKPYCSTESIGPRLIITKISNCNFKSYAGEVVLGPFSNVSVPIKIQTQFWSGNVKMFSVLPCYYRPERQWQE